MHSLVHVCDDVRRFGALDEFSAFPFENTLGRMKRMLRNGNKPLQQICRRLSEQGMAAYAFNKPTSFSPTLSRPHCNGPCLGIEGVQYARVEYGAFTYSIDGCDSYASLDTGKLVIIDNIIDSNTDGIIVVGRSFCKCESFYSYPCASDNCLLYTSPSPRD